MNVQDTLNERQHTHGDFTDNARVMQELKFTLRSEPGWLGLTSVQREALEMICHKIGRIVTGNSDEPDHWLDIEGYARLVRERL
jgi:hypothetical protein